MLVRKQIAAKQVVRQLLVIKKEDRLSKEGGSAVQQSGSVAGGSRADGLIEVVPTLETVTSCGRAEAVSSNFALGPSNAANGDLSMPEQKLFLSFNCTNFNHKYGIV